MSFRKDNKTERVERLKWDALCEANWELIERIGLPLSAIEIHTRFQYFLMHGSMYPYEDWSGFSVTQLRRDEPERYELLMLLLDRYFEAGFEDPGLGPFSNAEKLRLAKKYPKQFPLWQIEASDENLDQR